MKRWIRPVLTAAMLLCTVVLLANHVLVKGTVKFPNGAIVTNFPLVISVEPTSSTSCQDSKSVVTNQNGVYEAGLTCTADIQKVSITYKGCNGNAEKIIKEVPASLLVEYNITLCRPTNCKAVFDMVLAANTANTVYVNSHLSEASGPWPDEIVSRRYTWGDGTATDGNLLATSHTYASPGQYEICLIILTRNGCESKKCQLIQVPPPTNCVASFVTSFASNAANTIHVNSSNSKPTGSTDEIISRRYVWGDGSTTDGNLVETNHTYAHAGEYEVCLVIKTKKGCESKECRKLVIGANTGCTVYFNIFPTNANNKLYYFTDTSKVVAGDEIVSRVWSFGDGSPLTDGNLRSTSHTYPGPGTYTVCLEIKTKLGCQKKECKTISIAGDPCTAVFAFEYLVNNTTVPPNSVRFNSANSFGGNPSSAIIARRWDFGDGTFMEGNNINPVHSYAHAGTYNVCLTIKTAANCISTLCRQVIIQPAGCKALFKWEPIPGAIVNPPLSYIVFYGGASHGSTSTSAITGRRWDFGDGTILESMDSTVKHGYTRAGTYTVCLYIKTSDGCRDTVCNKVVVPNPPNTACVPGFSWKQDYLKFLFNSESSSVIPGDSIIKRVWYFGDGSSEDGNHVSTDHIYKQPGQYQVCLAITTRNGCHQTICKTVSIVGCEAVFRFEMLPTASPTGYYFKFFSGASHSASNNYQVISRRWTFGDGTVLESNDTNVVHRYEKPGIYQVCLTINTNNGCTNTTCKTVVIQNTTTAACHANFESTVSGMLAIFNSSNSTVGAGDSIVKRIWSFGDGTGADGNQLKVDHRYQREGQYEVCLAIVTKMGCQQKICKTVVVSDPQSKCSAIFRFERMSSGKLVFNSNMSFTQIPNDSIVKRIWTFGDGYSLAGNIKNPSHEYRIGGTYTVCLRVVTAAGCEKTTCQIVNIDGRQVGDSSHIKLIGLYPNPVRANLYTLIWSKQQGVQAKLSVYDVYGNLKWTKDLILPQGNSTWPVYVGNLPAGPYILRLTTQYGIQRQQFFKVN